MAIVDPIADMLTRIRNGLTARHEKVTVPSSNVKMAIANILVEEGYIKSATVIKDEKNVQDNIEIELKYGANYAKVISGLKRISRPGLRVYAKAEELPKVLNGLGIAIISTSKGIMTDKKARAIGAGGEVLAYVW
ncbi:MAG: 30S ribosomal protein S8 [Christensenellales bacterium]